GAGQTSFASISATHEVLLVPRERSTHSLPGAQVDGAYFSTLGVGATLGRTSGPLDDAASAPPVIVLGEHLWRAVFAGDPRVLGSTWRVNTTSYVIVGVVPASNDVLGVAAWVSAPGADAEWYSGIARLRPGLTAQHAQAQLDALTPQPFNRQPHDPRPGALVTPLNHALRGVSNKAEMFAAAIALLVVAAVVNLGTLFLVRLLGRMRQVAISTALGASPTRLQADAMLEGLTLGIVAAGVALIVMYVTRSAVGAFISTTLVGRAELLPTTALVLAFVVIGAALTGASVATAAHGWVRRLDLVRFLHGGGAGSAVTRSHARWRRLLVSVQVALAVVTCGIAARLMQSARYLGRIPLGYDAEHLLVAPLDIWNSEYGIDSSVHRLIDRIDQEFAGVPDLGSPAMWATIGFPMPAGPDDVSLKVEGSALKIGIRCNFSTCATAVHPITPNGFSVLDIRLTEGRRFDVSDRAGSAPVAIVNQQAVRAWFGGESPIGRRLRIHGRAGFHEWRTVVGTVADATELTSFARVPGAVNAGNVQPVIYIPMTQSDLAEAQSGMDYPLYVGVRPPGSRQATALAMRTTLSRLMPDLQAPTIAPMSAVIERDGPQGWVHANVVVAAIATAVILLLALIGIGGVVAESVRHRTRELGVRLALGATDTHLVRLICADTSRWLFGGGGAGIVVSRVLQSSIAKIAFGGTSTARPQGILLFGPTSAGRALGAAAALILGAGMLAAFLPARVAARSDPIQALRSGAE
ncbi:MAG: ABC transporter permease, partial [Gemmatimonadales bacterium]